jgi:hypothetical protein
VSLCIAGWRDLRRLRIPDHRSPAASIRLAMFLSVNVRGATAPLATSSHVHGADTGAPGLDRTAYTAAWVALQPFRPVSTRIREPRSAL